MQLSSKERKTFKILSIDGGGLRGICPVLILKEIEKKTGKKIHELFDMVAGTSTGSLIAIGITACGDNPDEPNLSLDDIEKIYTKRGTEIFPLRTGISKFYHSIRSFFRPEFEANGLDNVINDIVGDKRIMDCVLPLFITAYDLNTNSPLFFKTRHAYTKKDANPLLFDIARATSAGPTFLPAHAFTFREKERLCVDGGIYMNNPTLGALIELVKYGDNEVYNAPGINFDTTHVLSLSTGSYEGPICKRDAMKWGKMQWISPLIDTMMRGVNQTTDYQVSEILNPNKEEGKSTNYLRIDLDIDDKKHAIMTNSSQETQDYLRRIVDEQVLKNDVVIKNLDSFLINAGIELVD